MFSFFAMLYAPIWTVFTALRVNDPENHLVAVHSPTSVCFVLANCFQVSQSCCFAFIIIDSLSNTIKVCFTLFLVVFSKNVHEFEFTSCGWVYNN